MPHRWFLRIRNTSITCRCTETETKKEKEKIGEIQWLNESQLLFGACFMFQTLPSMGPNLMIIIRWEKPKVHTILISLAVFVRYGEGARLERKSNWRVLNSMFSRWFCVDVPRTISRWNSIEQISLRCGPVYGAVSFVFSCYSFIFN